MEEHIRAPPCFPPITPFKCSSVPICIRWRLVVGLIAGTVECQIAVRGVPLHLYTNTDLFTCMRSSKWRWKYIDGNVVSAALLWRFIFSKCSTYIQLFVVCKHEMWDLLCILCKTTPIQHYGLTDESNFTPLWQYDIQVEIVNRLDGCES